MIWSLVAPALASKYRVIVFDNRGIGQSSGNDSPLSIPQMAEDAAQLLDVLQVGPAHLAGHSMGGMIAQEVAFAGPEKVRTLSLLSTSAGVNERGKAIIEAWGDLPGVVDQRTAARPVLPWIYSSAFYGIPGAVEQLTYQILTNPFPPRPEVLFSQSRAVGNWSATDRLRDLDCPTLVLTGAEDMLVPPVFSEQLARSIRGAELVVLPATGHGLLVESPKAVATVLLDFLSRQRG